MKKEVRRLKTCLGMQAWTIDAGPITAEALEEVMGPGKEGMGAIDVGRQALRVSYLVGMPADGVLLTTAHEMVHALLTEMGVTPSGDQENYTVSGMVLEHLVDRVAVALLRAVGEV
jgi:hypothetical protein